MRLQLLLGGALSLASMVLSVAASATGAEEVTEPAISALLTFPEDNAFGQVVNGEKNKVFVFIDNNSDKNVTLDNIAGSVHHAESGALIKNTTTTPYGLKLMAGAKFTLPYTFYSEFKPGDLKLHVWIQHTVDETAEKYRVTAHDQVVTVVEPQESIFDLKMLITYLVTLGLFSGLGYYAYLTFVPQPKRTRKAHVPEAGVSDPLAVTATGAGGYQEEWIPVHHLKRTKSGAKVPAGEMTSGDELSASEASGAEAKKGKGKGKGKKAL